MSFLSKLRRLFVGKPPAPSKEAVEALEQAEKGKAHAEEVVSDLDMLVKQLKAHRSANHFAPLVRDALRQKRTN